MISVTISVNDLGKTTCEPASCGKRPVLIDLFNKSTGCLSIRLIDLVIDLAIDLVNDLHRVSLTK